MKYSFKTLIFFLLIALPYYSNSQSLPSSYVDKLNLLKAMVGKPAPEFSATTLEGKLVNSQTLEGKIVVVNFWFVECSPCKEEMPLLNKLTEEYKSNNNIIFLSFARNDKKAVQKFLETTEFKYKIVPGAKDIAQSCNVSGYPSHFIIDQQGIIRFASIGSQDDINTFLYSKIQEVLNNSESKNQVSSEILPKIAINQSTIFKTEDGSIIAYNDAMKMLTGQQYILFREKDKEGKDYFTIKKKN